MNLARGTRDKGGAQGSGKSGSGCQLAKDIGAENRDRDNADRSADGACGVDSGEQVGFGSRGSTECLEAVHVGGARGEVVWVASAFSLVIRNCDALGSATKEFQRPRFGSKNSKGILNRSIRSQRNLRRVEFGCKGFSSHGIRL